jgi:hypothetical protein
MSDVEELEKRIEGLSTEELTKFRAWFAEFDAQTWDRQIEKDAKSGKLDSLVREAKADYKAKKSREL